MSYSSSPVNGKYIHRTVGQFICNEGYYYVGYRYTICGISGKWDNYPTGCKGKIILKNYHSILISLQSIFPSIILQIKTS